LSGIDLPLHASASQNATSGLIFLSSSPSACYVNPAFSANTALEAGTCYLFNIKELPFYSFHATKKLNSINVYLGSTFLGHPDFRETTTNVSLNYNKSVLSYGVALKLVHRGISDIKDETMINANLGAIYRNGTINVSLAADNIVTFKSSSFIGEINTRLSEKGSISLGFEKEPDFDFTLKLGSNYQLHEILTILCSYQHSPERIGSGVIIHLTRMNISYSVLTHQYLDLTHFISICYEL
jgi:hypothetical protein